ncbi:unnamed protein product [Schistocephalus solidus]|uniref:RGS domain-containing protein n=1 Tax=Schistocephalus solidus TaxID=70667 RepID=A0A183TSD6_SCHSO|nr:unnamed protein product [Schistocephalus solidus]
MDGNSVEVVENCDKAEYVGRFIASVFTREPQLQLDHVNSAVIDAGPVLEYILFQEPLVERELQNLKEEKPSGPNDIPAKQPRGDVIQTYRIISGRECALEFADFFELAGTEHLRDHPFKLQRKELQLQLDHVNSAVIDAGLMLEYILIQEPLVE